MTRIPCRTLAACALAAATVAQVGCTAKTKVTTPTTSGTNSSSASSSDQPFQNWPKPDAALVITGQQDGYLEPCGCTAGQKGGLGRRYDFLDRLKVLGWNLAPIDLGSLINDPAADRGGPEESKIKFGIALKALEAMHYQALALSADDLKLGVFDALGEYLNNLRERPKVLAANVTPADGLDPESRFRKAVRVTAGPIKIGITAVLDPKTLDALNDSAKADLLVVKDPAEVLPAILKDLEADTNAQVLMVQGPPEKARDLARAHPGFDVVVATSHLADPPKDPEMLNDGKTMLITVGKKGQYVGVVGLFQTDDPSRKYRYQRVVLSNRLKQAEPMRKLIDEDFQELLKQAAVVENFPRHAYTGGAPGAEFVGAESCKTCHPNTFTRWQGVAHARAFDDLTKRNRTFDAECISCHTTGFGYETGWVSAERTPHLKGNQCENCHGPGSKHVAEPDHPEFRKAMALTAESADRNGLCIRCHDEDNSPKFDFKTHYGKIVHKGMDTYSDPKVHQGRPSKIAAKRAP